MAEYKTYNNKFMKKKIFYIVLTMIVSSAVVVEKMGWWEHLWFNGIVCLVTVFIKLRTMKPFLLLLRPGFILQLGSRDQSLRLNEVNLRFVTKRSNYEPILMVN